MSSVFFCFQSSEQTPKPEKHCREVLYVKMTFSFVLPAQEGDPESATFGVNASRIRDKMKRKRKRKKEKENQKKGEKSEKEKERKN